MNEPVCEPECTGEGLFPTPVPSPASPDPKPSEACGQEHPRKPEGHRMEAAGLPCPAGAVPLARETQTHTERGGGCPGSGPRTKNHRPSGDLPGRRAPDKASGRMKRREGTLGRENGFSKGTEAGMNSCLMREEGPHSGVGMLIVSPCSDNSCPVTSRLTLHHRFC